MLKNTMGTVQGGMQVESFSIVIGEYYKYSNNHAVKLNSCIYQVIRIAKHFPSFQDQIIYRAVTGPEVGAWFTCTKNNFVTHFEDVTEADRKTFGLPSKIV